MRTTENLHRHELIGLMVEISGGQPLTGKVIDETRNMFLVETKGGVKKIPKKGNVFTFPKYGREIGGSELVARPEDRIKK